LKAIFIFFLPLFLGLSFQVLAQEKTETPSASVPTEPKSTAEYFVICRNLKVVRTLRVEVTPEKCTAIYTKLGQDRSIGSSQRGTSMCRGFVDQVRDTISKAGWKCKEMKSGQVLHLNE